ncbi:MAG: peptidylprolyl isomerase [Dehalococcoidales bacterium]
MNNKLVPSIPIQKHGLFILVSLAFILLLNSCNGSAGNDNARLGTEPEPAPLKNPASYSEPPLMVIDTDKQFTATIETEKGNIVLELFAGDVPITVNNFVFLAREGFYDGTTFHRIIAGFMAQGGDPTGTGMGGPGYSFADEFTSHTHVTGALSMANAGPDTNGSQFFITYAPQHHLDNHHSVFGQLTDGMAVLEALENGDTVLRIIIEER